MQTGPLRDVLAVLKTDSHGKEALGWEGHASSNLETHYIIAGG